MSTKLEITVKNDGTYLIITSPPGKPEKVPRAEVVTLIEAYGLTDVDYVALNNTLKEEIESMEIKLSDKTEIKKATETVTAEISRDRMEAYITFTKPPGAEPIDINEAAAVIERAGITAADKNLLARVMDMHRSGVPYTIAKGAPPQKGEDGRLHYHFDSSSLAPKPKLKEDGTVDFRDLGLIRLINKGDILVSHIPAKEGIDGYDVCGRVLPAQKGRPASPLPRGKNTTVSNDGLNLIAEVSGVLEIQAKKINVLACFEIKGDVDNSTGNIDFTGSVTIKGNVLTGFTVKATGNIEIGGVCEAATLISGSNIVLGNGAKGMDKALIEAAGDVTAKYIEGCHVIAGGNISADSIVNSTVNCDGNVILMGKYGLLVGGVTLVGEKIIAKSIGSPMGGLTELQVGNNPKDLTKYKDSFAEQTRLKSELERVEVAVNSLKALQKKDQLNDEKKELLLKMINVKLGLQTKITELQNEMDEHAGAMNSSSGSVSASKFIRPGVKVVIGNAQMLVTDEISNCTLRNNGEKIIKVPYSEA
ncbi:MAG: FapA family protein [Defluviitaleaceae bacterium]|nr:FapA family protein [Defluviitaleaceae bacterium]